MSLTIRVEPHPLLEIGAFVTRIARPLASTRTPQVITDLDRLGNEPVPESRRRAFARAHMCPRESRRRGDAKGAKDHSAALVADPGSRPRCIRTGTTCVASKI
jgi:hypothetical protein